MQPNQYTAQEALNRMLNGAGGSTVGAASTGRGQEVKGVARDVGGKQTRTAGQVSDMIVDFNENQWIRESYQPLYEDNVAQVAKVEQRYTSYIISTAGTFVVKSGAGYAQTLTYLGGTAGAISVYDNTAASGTQIVPTFTPNGTVPAPSVDLYAVFNTGLTIVTATAMLLQISYR